MSSLMNILFNYRDQQLVVENYEKQTKCDSSSMELFYPPSKLNRALRDDGPDFDRACWNVLFADQLKNFLIIL